MCFWLYRLLSCNKRHKNQQNVLSIENTYNCFVNPSVDPFTCNFRFKIRSKAIVWVMYAPWTPPQSVNSLRKAPGPFHCPLLLHSKLLAQSIWGWIVCTMRNLRGFDNNVLASWNGTLAPVMCHLFIKSMWFAGKDTGWGVRRHDFFCYFCDTKKFSSAL